MIEKSVIEQLVNEKIEGTDLYLVEIKIDSNNSINISIDSPVGVDVVVCVGISKHVELSLDREIEDFAIEVSSPGIGVPFKVIEQYKKVLGKTIEVLFNSGEKLKGILAELNNDNFIIEYSVKEKPEGAKRPKMVDKIKTIDFEEVKSTIEIITF